MKAIVTLVKKTDLEELIERNNADEIKSMIADKERELEEAEDKAQWYYDIGLDEWSDNEMAKQRKLIRDIEKLKAALQA